MLRSDCPNISIITNFGCDYNCWYCIWRGHELEHVREPTDWNKLDCFLKQHSDKCKVSLSGGGDPLYKFYENIEWWSKLLSLLEKYDMRLQIHTRTRLDLNPLTSLLFGKFVDKFVISCDDFTEEDYDYLRRLSRFTKIRIVHVVTLQTTDEMVLKFITSAMLLDAEFTAKELVGFNDNGRFDEIKVKYPTVFMLSAGDYNIYYMPDNTIKKTFINE